jgi:hypothetical protein
LELWCWGREVGQHEGSPVELQKSKSALTLLLFSFFFLGDSKSRFWKFISSILVWAVPLA